MSKRTRTDRSLGRYPEPITIRPQDHVRALTPPPGLGETINPLDYYITTGEAVMKARQLVKEIAQHRDSLLLHPPTPEVADYGRQVALALAEAEEFLAELVRLRGNWLWLECERQGDSVYCQHKTSKLVPRPKE